MIHVGAAGYHYDDWIGPFYPPDLPRERWLGYYAERFGLVEINNTFYRPPTERLVAGWAERAPASFRFTVKAWQGLTHGDEADDRDYTNFAAALQPLLDRRMLLGVLLQYPHRFRLDKTNVARLRRLRDRWPELPLVVEFRHASWADPRTFDFLRQQRLAWCCVDEPRLRGLLPPVSEATAAPAYVRFHGRNARQWYDHQAAWQRYDYLYSEAELQPWIERVRALARLVDEVCVIFNNHRDGQAPLNAIQFGRLLAQ